MYAIQDEETKAQAIDIVARICAKHRETILSNMPRIGVSFSMFLTLASAVYVSYGIRFETDAITGEDITNVGFGDCSTVNTKFVSAPESLKIFFFIQIGIGVSIAIATYLLMGNIVSAIRKHSPRVGLFKALFVTVMMVGFCVVPVLSFETTVKCNGNTYEGVLDLFLFFSLVPPMLTMLSMLTYLAWYSSGLLFGSMYLDQLMKVIPEEDHDLLFQLDDLYKAPKGTAGVNSFCPCLIMLFPLAIWLLTNNDLFLPLIVLISASTLISCYFMFAQSCCSIHMKASNLVKITKYVRPISKYILLPILHSLIYVGVNSAYSVDFLDARVVMCSKLMADWLDDIVLGLLIYQCGRGAYILPAVNDWYKYDLKKGVSIELA